MGDILRVQFFIENRVGAGGNIGADMTAKSAPGGYTPLIATVSTFSRHQSGLYPKMPYNPIRDFAPIAQIGVMPTLLGVHPSVPAKDIKSLIALTKENPGKYTYCSSGVGSRSSGLAACDQCHATAELASNGMSSRRLIRPPH